MRRFRRATERSSRPGLVVCVRCLTAAWALLALTLLRGVAVATPAEPLWVAGVSDAGDWDDHVQSITRLADAPGDGRAPVIGPALPSAESIEPTAATGFALIAVATLRSRAPPIR